MTVAQVADELQVTDRSVRLWIAEGRITAYRVRDGRSIRLRRADVEQLLEPIPAA
ncbi:excisionase family DNA-binding protein [Mycolicibacterium pulveris]|nr:excisionase family DNA-binding protein [Mycolicibacterium pulveris]MCV6982176.1 excisionase family DNA-binding protein [Mycolicibacterium pulveris]